MNEIHLLRVPCFPKSNTDLPPKAQRQRVMLDLDTKTGKVTARCVDDRLCSLLADDRVYTVLYVLGTKIQGSLRIVIIQRQFCTGPRPRSQLRMHKSADVASLHDLHVCLSFLHSCLWFPGGFPTELQNNNL